MYGSSFYQTPVERVKKESVGWEIGRRKSNEWTI